VLNRAFSLLLVVCLATGPLWAATDLFVGEWKLDISRSKIFDRMKVESIGGNRYSVDGSDGEPELSRNGHVGSVNESPAVERDS
jgi:hypothetical protein